MVQSSEEPTPRTQDKITPTRRRTQSAPPAVQIDAFKAPFLIAAPDLGEPPAPDDEAGPAPPAAPVALRTARGDFDTTASEAFRERVEVLARGGDWDFVVQEIYTPLRQAMDAGAVNPADRAAVEFMDRLATQRRAEAATARDLGDVPTPLGGDCFVYSVLAGALVSQGDNLIKHIARQHGMAGMVDDPEVVKAADKDEVVETLVARFREHFAQTFLDHPERYMDGFMASTHLKGVDQDEYDLLSSPDFIAQLNAPGETLAKPYTGVMNVKMQLQSLGLLHSAHKEMFNGPEFKAEFSGSVAARDAAAFGRASEKVAAVLREVFHGLTEREQVEAPADLERQIQASLQSSVALTTLLHRVNVTTSADYALKPVKTDETYDQQGYYAAYEAWQDGNGVESNLDDYRIPAQVHGFVILPSAMVGGAPPDPDDIRGTLQLYARLISQMGVWSGKAEYEMMADTLGKQIVTLDERTHSSEPVRQETVEAGDPDPIVVNVSPIHATAALPRAGAL